MSPLSMPADGERMGKGYNNMAVVERSCWQKIIQDVVANGGNIIRPWFTELDPVCLEHGLLEIKAPGLNEKNYCEHFAVRLFTEAAQKATGHLVGVCFLAGNEISDEDNDTSTPLPPQNPSAAETATAERPAAVKLCKEYVFENFVTGPCNRLAHAASLAVCEGLGKTYNPLFLHGASGLGKTHLLQAICHRVLGELPDAKIEFLTCEMFVNHFIDAVEKGKLHEFRYRYRHVDLLVIDDIQFLADHEQSQEEFFHTFNTLYQDQKQIILSSDRGPQEIDLEERLVSRFNWGMVTRIDRPCYETRVAIIHKKARQRGIALDEDVVCFLASSIDTNTRELEGALAKVTMLSQVMNQPIDITIAADALGKEATPKKHDITIDDILKAVTRRFNVRLTDLQSHRRTRSVALPRQVCMYLARRMTRHSLEEIGGYFGGRDHTTVMHANKSIENLRGQDPQFQATLEKITDEITAGL